MTTPAPKEERAEAMAMDYMSWTKPEVCRALAARVNELKRVSAERDQYKQIAELNHDTIMRIQGEREPPHCSSCGCGSGP